MNYYFIPGIAKTDKIKMMVSKTHIEYLIENEVNKASLPIYNNITRSDSKRRVLIYVLDKAFPRNRVRICDLFNVSVSSISTCLRLFNYHLEQNIEQLKYLESFVDRNGFRQKSDPLQGRLESLLTVHTCDKWTKSNERSYLKQSNMFEKLK